MRRLKAKTNDNNEREKDGGGERGETLIILSADFGVG
jgi:hypothetical protein